MSFATVEAYHRPPRADRRPRWFRAQDIASSVSALAARIALRPGNIEAANSSAPAIATLRPIAPAVWMFRELPSFAPATLLGASAALVHSEMRLRSFSAKA